MELASIIGLAATLLPMLQGQESPSQMFEGQRPPFQRLPPDQFDIRGGGGSYPLYDFDMERFREQSPMLRRQPQMSATPMMYPYLGR